MQGKRRNEIERPKKKKTKIKQNKNKKRIETEDRVHLKRGSR